MNYRETTEWLFAQLPVFQRTGGGPQYKIDLDKTLDLMGALDHPERSFESIHVAGTNGKGSTSHLLASVLQSQGYTVGLYTSPHLMDFRERIRINGRPLSEEEVVRFVANHQEAIQSLSFFEMTVGMAFDAFRRHAVDVAVVEVGMGGRLDSTNVLTPRVSVITNIGLDHTAYLGSTRKAIAAEKAGIIKPGVPVVLGERDDETAGVFLEIARKNKAPVWWAQEHIPEPLPCGLLGTYQKQNVQCVQTTLEVVREYWPVSVEAMRKGLANVCQLTGLRGRWEILSSSPFTIADTGHNAHGIEVVAQQLKDVWEEKGGELYLVLGAVNDKDPKETLALWPKDAHFVFVQAQIPRALPANDLALEAQSLGIQGRIGGSVAEGLDAVYRLAGPNDIVFVGGSTFVVADALTINEARNGTPSQWWSQK